MKLTKNAFVLMAMTGLLALSPSVRAQTNTPPAGPPPAPAKHGGGLSVDARLDRMDRELKLTEAQKPKVKAVLEAENQKARELRNDTSLTKEARREKMQAVVQEGSLKLKGILTPEQFTKYEAQLHQARQHQHAGGAGGDKGAATGAGDQ